MDSKITAIEEYWENIAKAWAEFWTHPSIEGGITLSIACLTLIAIIVFIIYKVWAHFKLAKMQLEADIETIVKPITKYAVTVEHAEEIAYHLDKALYLAKDGRKGPVWIDLPLNVQNAMVNEETLERFIPKNKPLNLTEDDLNDVISLYQNAKRPVLLVGNGVRSARAKKELKDLAYKYNLPIVFSRLAADILPYDDKYNFGLIGGVAGANRYANFIVQNSDLVLAIGSRLSIEVTGGIIVFTPASFFACT